MKIRGTEPHLKVQIRAPSNREAADVPADVLDVLEEAQD